MRVLIVYCHPSPASFTAAILQQACRALADMGHETEIIDLYAEGFNPAMSLSEWQGYHTPVENEKPVAAHLAALRRADALLFVYPTWWYGQPAMLKGWLDRVLVPHGTFAMPEPGKPIRGLLPNITRLAVLTTLGSPKWWWFLMGMPGRRILLTGVRMICHRRCRTAFLGLHQMDSVTAAQRKQHLEKVTDRLRTFMRLS